MTRIIGLAPAKSRTRVRKLPLKSTMSTWMKDIMNEQKKEKQAIHGTSGLPVWLSRLSRGGGMKASPWALLLRQIACPQDNHRGHRLQWPYGHETAACILRRGQFLVDGASFSGDRRREMNPDSGCSVWNSYWREQMWNFEGRWWSAVGRKVYIYYYIRVTMNWNHLLGLTDYVIVGVGRPWRINVILLNSEYEVYEEAFAGGEGKGKKLGGIGTSS